MYFVALTSFLLAGGVTHTLAHTHTYTHTRTHTHTHLRAGCVPAAPINTSCLFACACAIC